MLTSGYGPRAASGFENDAPRGEPADPFLPADVGRLRTSGDFPGRRAPVTTLRSWAPQRPALGLLPFFAVLFLYVLPLLPRWFRQTFHLRRSWQAVRPQWPHRPLQRAHPLIGAALEVTRYSSSARIGHLGGRSASYDGHCPSYADGFRSSVPSGGSRLTMPALSPHLILHRNDPPRRGVV